MTKKLKRFGGNTQGLIFPMSKPVAVTAKRDALFYLYFYSAPGVAMVDHG